MEIRSDNRRKFFSTPKDTMGFLKLALNLYISRITSFNIVYPLTAFMVGYIVGGTTLYIAVLSFAVTLAFLEIAIDSINYDSMEPSKKEKIQIGSNPTPSIFSAYNLMTDKQRYLYTAAYTISLTYIILVAGNLNYKLNAPFSTEIKITSDNGFPNTNTELEFNVDNGPNFYNIDKENFDFEKNKNILKDMKYVKFNISNPFNVFETLFGYDFVISNKRKCFIKKEEGCKYFTKQFIDDLGRE